MFVFVNVEYPFPNISPHPQNPHPFLHESFNATLVNDVIVGPNGVSARSRVPMGPNTVGMVKMC